MKSILAYGDSLTWGYDAEGPSRHAFQDRWPTVLQGKLWPNAVVIAEGLNGRTTAFDDHTADCDRNGARTLPTVLESHGPLDLVIIMLGSNDMKPWIAGHALPATHGMGRLVEIVRGHRYPLDGPKPQVLIVAPPPLCETENREFDEMFGRRFEASKQLAVSYKALAAQNGTAFFDAGSVAKTTPLDGVHLDAANTRAIGEALAPVVRKLLGL